ncbi:MAG: sulfurtransferase [Candidatus Koribacter versatilis]|uniref:Sulfurtransferase n=1 Tax=Candidatus Korobacter versatilis TaxID=658062 RepID=A0A932ENQ7_9BACT|nr:sulfurtransferase [Candidatus Koribacter versatilis]
MTLPEFKLLVDDAKKEIKEIDAEELKRMQKSGEPFVLLDVREPDEHARGVIPGAVPIPRGMLEVNIDQTTTDKNAKIVCYCGGGSRSALAAQSLKRMGFKNPMSLIGGWRGWKEDGN